MQASGRNAASKQYAVGSMQIGLLPTAYCLLLTGILRL